MAILDLTRLTRGRRSGTARVRSCALRPSAAETAIHFTLDRKIDGPAAPLFLAVDKGYFKAEGLDVTIDAGGRRARAGQPPRLRQLRHGRRRHQCADQVPRRQSRKRRSRPLFIVFDKPAYAIIARKSRGIAAPRDLEGKKLGAPSADSAFAQWPIFAKVNGIDPAKVAIENVSLSVREPMLAAGEVDAITGCSFGSYVDLKAGGVPADDLVVLADGGLRGRALRRRHHGRAEIPRGKAGSGAGVSARLSEGAQGHRARSRPRHRVRCFAATTPPRRTSSSSACGWRSTTISSPRR